MRCRTVVLAASACESARLLLNSKATRHPQGLANSSGKVGRYLMDTVGSSMSAMVPALSGMPHYNSDGYGIHLYVPWWMWDRHKELNFPRGYHIEVGGGYGMPGIGSFTGVVNRTEGYGAADEAGDPRRVRHVGRPLRPRRDDPERAVVLRDRSGGEGPLGHPGAALPLAVERSRAEPGASHAGRPSAQILEGMGGRIKRRSQRRRPRRRADHGPAAARAAGAADRAGGSADRPDQRSCRAADDGGGRARRNAAAQNASRPPISRGGAIIHEVGTVRMGDDPQTSPLNKFCQAHEVKNLFVADAAPFVSNADKNPTHTIVALAWRTAEYLAEEMRKGNV